MGNSATLFSYLSFVPIRMCFSILLHIGNRLFKIPFRYKINLGSFAEVAMPVTELA